MEMVVERIEVTMCNGDEGPKHDPYSYTEFLCTLRDGVDLKLHLGLAEYLVIGDVQLDGYERMYILKDGVWEKITDGTNTDGLDIYTIESIFEMLSERDLEEVEDEFNENYFDDPMGCASDYI
jgi:hypothetical protein